jgi:LAO/AO transport system kinase
MIWAMVTDGQALARRLRDGDRRALARAISWVEDGAAGAPDLLRELYPHTGQARVFGITGPPGVGKSTLTGALVRVRRAAGRSVGVLSVDPSSPFTQGALLGDRIRLAEHFLDDGVYIRSMASRGALGGIAQATAQAVLLLDAAGVQDVLVETVGVGQADVDVTRLADTVVLVLMPGSGDSVQALKAGVMEIPDVIVVNKADHLLTDITLRELRGALAIGRAERSGAAWEVPVLATQALGGDGVDELAACLDRHHDTLVGSGELARRRAHNLRGETLALATAALSRRLVESSLTSSAAAQALEDVVARRLDPAAAALILARTVADRPAGEPNTLEG